MENNIILRKNVQHSNRWSSNIILKFGLVAILSIIVLFITNVNVSAKALKIKARSDKDNKVVFYVQDKDVNEVSVEQFDYTSESGKTYNKKNKISFKMNTKTGYFEATYSMKKDEYGEYLLGVEYYDEDGALIDVEYANVKYKEDKKFDIDVSNINQVINISEIGKFDGKFYNIDKGSGSEIHIKTNESIKVSVLYKRGTSKKINGKVYLMWGNKRIEPNVIKEEADMDADTGVYYSGATYTVSSSTDMSGTLVAYYEKTSGKYSSKSLGVTLDADGTAPKISVDKKYKTIDAKYYNKSIKIPITIEEKNFDETKTSVMLNGKKVSVSWSKSGDTNKADITLQSGKNDVEVTSTDKVGNNSDNVKISNIIIDTESPNVRITGFENGTGKGLVNGEYIAYPLSVIISDNEKIAENYVKLYRFDPDSNTNVQVELKNNTGEKSVEYFSEDIQDDGYYTLEVSAVDAAGNIVKTKNVKSEGTNPYKVNKGVVEGNFTVNREGSLYVSENSDLFNKPINEIQDIVIYEYNKNEIVSQNVTIISSVNSTVLNGEQYSFELVENDNSKYRYKYRYVIYKDIFSEGSYNIKINSTSIAGDNGSLIAKTKENNSLDKQIIIDKTNPEIISFEGTNGGKIRVKIRDNNIDEKSIKLQIGKKKYKLIKDDDNSTSTNMIFTCNVGKNPEGAKVACSDLAGNTVESTNIEISNESNVKVFLIYGIIAVSGLVVIVGAITIIIRIRKRK